MLYICFFFFKHKTAYEMRISDWSSDVCSSDLSSGEQRQCDALARIRAPERSHGIGRAEGEQHPARKGRDRRRDSKRQQDCRDDAVDFAARHVMPTRVRSPPNVKASFAAPVTANPTKRTPRHTLRERKEEV